MHLLSEYMPWFFIWKYGDRVESLWLWFSVPSSLQLLALAPRQHDEGFSALQPVALVLYLSETGRQEGFWVLFSTGLLWFPDFLWQAWEAGVLYALDRTSEPCKPLIECPECRRPQWPEVPCSKNWEWLVLKPVPLVSSPLKTAMWSELENYFSSIFFDLPNQCNAL